MASLSVMQLLISTPDGDGVVIFVGVAEPEAGSTQYAVKFIMSSEEGSKGAAKAAPTVELSVDKIRVTEYWVFADQFHRPPR